MIRHHAFFEALGSLDYSDQGWSSTLTGLSVLREIDSIAAAPDVDRGADIALRSARAMAISIPETDPSRAILARIIDLLEASGRLSPELARELMLYGRSLDLEARWPLAADVFHTIAEQFASPQCAAIAIESLIALGAAARNVGDWETSDRSYAEAQHRAEQAGNKALSLTAQVGVANTQVAHGNLPAADAELQEVLAEAGAAGYQQVEAIALHTCAYAAITRGDYEHAIHCAYRSLELTINETARDRILGDIAAAYAGLGMRDTARDAYAIVAVTSPHRWVRWQATLNLMELAVDELDELRFDELASQVSDQPLDPRLRSYLFLLTARGLRQFGRDGAEEFFTRAYDEAERHHLHQITFEIERARNATPVPTRRESLHAESDGTRAELDRIAEALMHLREEVAAS